MIRDQRIEELNGEIKKNSEKMEGLTGTPSKLKEVKKLKG
jgi:hypothetical protein